MKAPRFEGLTPASPRSSRTLAHVKSSTTACERVLSCFLEAKGIGFQRNATWLSGKPDLLFYRARVVVFCDGDFWHGRHWSRRRKKLSAGHNAPYWIAKIRANMRRDRLHQRALEAAGWQVLRFWESDILGATESVGKEIVRAIHRPTPRRTALRVRRKIR